MEQHVSKATRTNISPSGRRGIPLVHAAPSTPFLFPAAQLSDSDGIQCLPAWRMAPGFVYFVSLWDTLYVEIMVMLVSSQRRAAERGSLVRQLFPALPFSQIVLLFFSSSNFN